MTAEDLIAEINTEKPQIDTPEAVITPVETPETGQNQDILPTETPVVETDNSQTPAPEAVKSEPLSEDLIFNRLSELTGGKIKSKTDYEELVKQRDELQEQATKGFEPKFKNEREKWAHQLLSQSTGDEIGTAMRTLRALKYEPEGKDKKETLFEAYLLDPKNADLTEQKALEYFNADYEQKYGDIEGNILKQRELDLAHRSAKESILKVQTDFKAVDERPQHQAIAKDIENNVIAAVKSLTAVKIAFKDNPTENDFLNVALNDPKELQQLQEVIFNPDQAYNEMVAQFETDKGFDFNGLVRKQYIMRNAEKLIKEAFNQGKTIGDLERINKARNATDPKKPSDLGQVAGNKTPQTREEKWAAAMGV